MSHLGILYNSSWDGMRACFLFSLGNYFCESRFETHFFRSASKFYLIIILHLLTFNPSVCISLHCSCM